MGLLGGFTLDTRLNDHPQIRIRPSFEHMEDHPESSNIKSPEVVHPNHQVTSKITFNISISSVKITCENHVQHDIQDHPTLFINTWCGSK